MITKVYDDLVSYEVGKDNVVSIEPSDMGSDKVNMYKITFENGEYLFLGLKEHEVIKCN